MAASPINPILSFVHNVTSNGTEKTPLSPPGSTSNLDDSNPTRVVQAQPDMALIPCLDHLKTHIIKTLSFEWLELGSWNRKFLARTTIESPKLCKNVRPWERRQGAGKKEEQINTVRSSMITSRVSPSRPSIDWPAGDGNRKSEDTVDEDKVHPTPEMGEGGERRRSSDPPALAVRPLLSSGFRMKHHVQFVKFRGSTPMEASLAAVGRQSLVVLFWALTGRRELGNGEEVIEENPDDAAVDNSGTGVTKPWPCICHAQFENPSEGTASASLFPVALSCQQKV
ncbi:hypothetical protein RJ639_021747 [Escallonia herrerae]|uniref:Uncharacterized protein n=1 Tax=Escallonia herrerae TaxID=1293975 RepID=A0AA89AH38_9ASTE|nr:hypothetical protein RJ639_021747 [Escallonia herrerae]